ncbi:MAG: hypothetical protein L6R38_007335 [Xanthoria sp. 2 TBL-2021]|nr:MAG: hypothetical protein L6R38_007335 [Xanthoria sp. 2 TBL-2021]
MATWEGIPSNPRVCCLAATSLIKRRVPENHPATPTNIQPLHQTSSPAAPPPIPQRTLPALTPELVLWIARHEKYRDDKTVDENYAHIAKWEAKQARLERKNRGKEEKERDREEWEREERERGEVKALKAKLEVLEATVRFVDSISIADQHVRCHQMISAQDK